MRRRATGLTLMELLIAMLVFLMVMTAIVSIFFMANHAQRKGSAQTDAYRAVFLALKQVETSLQGCQLLVPLSWEDTDPPVNEIRFYFPTMQDGRLVLDATGTPMWAGQATITFEPGGQLVYRELNVPNSDRLLAAMGPDSNVEFQRAERDLLSVTARAKFPDEANGFSQYEFAVTLRLANQP